MELLVKRRLGDEPTNLRFGVAGIGEHDQANSTGNARSQRNHHNVGITIINHPKQITIDSWYKPFPNGWFILVIPTLITSLSGYRMAPQGLAPCPCQASTDLQEMSGASAQRLQPSVASMVGS